MSAASTLALITVMFLRLADSGLSWVRGGSQKENYANVAKDLQMIPVARVDGSGRITERVSN